MITYDELKKLAELAKLSLDGEDIGALAKDIRASLSLPRQSRRLQLICPTAKRRTPAGAYVKIFCSRRFRPRISCRTPASGRTAFVARRKGGQAE